MLLSSAPAQLVLPWGNSDSSKTSPIPVPSQIGVTPGAASWTDGFPPLCATPVTSGGVPPAKADMNGSLFQMSAIDVWYSAGAGFPYNSGFSTAIGGYPKGARVLMASGLGYWRSTVDNNTTDPDTGGAGWVGEPGSLSVNVTPVTANAASSGLQALMSYAFPAGLLNLIGKRVRLSSQGVFTMEAAETLALSFLIDSDTIDGPTITASTGVTGYEYGFEIELTTITTGTSGTLLGTWKFFLQDITDITSPGVCFFTAIEPTADLTVLETLQFNAQFSIASASNSITQSILAVGSEN